jgi:hypothetical protein
MQNNNINAANHVFTVRGIVIEKSVVIAQIRAIGPKRTIKITNPRMKNANSVFIDMFYLRGRA